MATQRPSIYYSKEFFKMKFSSDTMKSAYLNACKWYATNVMAKDELHNVQVEFEKLKDEQLPTVVIHLYAVLSEDELRERFCKLCRECHSAFYMRSATPCDKCEANAYQRRTDEMLRIKLDYYRGLISKQAKENT